MFDIKKRSVYIELRYSNLAVLILFGFRTSVFFVYIKLIPTGFYRILKNASISFND